MGLIVKERVLLLHYIFIDVIRQSVFSGNIMNTLQTFMNHSWEDGWLGRKTVSK